jgi:serine/threonine-protein kinase
MGVVVSAVHLALGERVALKFLSSAAPGVAAARLRREAQIAVRLRSQHAARLMDIGTLGSGAPFLVMEYLDGRDLAKVLRAQGPMPVQTAADYVLQACEAVAEAHGLGIVHRDLKPSNLFLTAAADGSPLVKVLDFGIAKLAQSASTHAGGASNLTVTAAVLGSPRYMSPEQVRSATGVDARTDIWSLGVILHELIAGRPPFDAESSSAVLAAIVADPPTRLRACVSAPAALETLILRCLEKDAARRFPDVAAFATALGPFASARAQASIQRIADVLGPHGTARTAEPVVTPSTWSMPTTRSKRSKLYAAVATAGIGALALFAFGRPNANRATTISSLPMPIVPTPPVSVALSLEATAATAPRAVVTIEEPSPAFPAPTARAPEAATPIAPRPSATASVRVKRPHVIRPASRQAEPSQEQAKPLQEIVSANSAETPAPPVPSAATSLAPAPAPPRPGATPASVPDLDVEAATAGRH